MVNIVDGTINERNAEVPLVKATGQWQKKIQWMFNI